MESGSTTSAVAKFAPATSPGENGPSMQSVVMSHLGYTKTWMGEAAGGLPSSSHSHVPKPLPQDRDTQQCLVNEGAPFFSARPG